MSPSRVLFLFLFLCCFYNKITAQAISVNATVPPEDLIQNVLINSSCIETQNVSAKETQRQMNKATALLQRAPTFHFLTELF